MVVESSPGNRSVAAKSGLAMVTKSANQKPRASEARCGNGGRVQEARATDCKQGNGSREQIKEKTKSEVRPWWKRAHQRGGAMTAKSR